MTRSVDCTIMLQHLHHNVTFTQRSYRLSLVYMHLPRTLSAAAT